MFDFGVAFTDTPDVTLVATTDIPVPGLDEDVAELKKDVEDFFDNFKLYPIIAVSFFYRF